MGEGVWRGGAVYCPQESPLSVLQVFREGEVAVTEPSDARDALDRLVTEAAQQITRLVPADAAAACEAGGLIIDIRSQEARKVDGVAPSSAWFPPSRRCDRWLRSLGTQRPAGHTRTAASSCAGHSAGDGATGLERKGSGLGCCHIGDNRV
jgi:hypothetical protein